MPELAADESDEQVAGDRSGAAAVAPIRLTDGERLMRFWRYRDEAAFAELVETHAGLVWGVCAQVLRHRQDVEDAFQATFLILARKAKSIRSTDSVAGWLYRVAFRTALLARERASRRFELPLLDDPISDDDHYADLARREQCVALLEELHAMPARYRDSLVLCYFEGRSRRQAAEQLGVTQQTVKGRLARGMRILRSRLVRRGLALSTTIVVTRTSMAAAQSSMNWAMVTKTASMGLAFATKTHLLHQAVVASSQGAIQASFILAEKGMIAMTIAAVSKPAVGFLGACLVAGSLAVATADGPVGGGSPGSGGSTGESTTAISLAANDANEAVQADKAKAEKPAEKPEETAAPKPAAENKAPDDVLAKQSTLDLATDPNAANTTSAAPAPTPTRDVLIQAPAGGTFIREPGPIMSQAVAQGFSSSYSGPVPFRFAVSNSETPPSRTSIASLKIESEYWDLKGRGLEKKAKALTTKAKSMKESGNSSEVEILETEAEADLASAEVKFSEMNALRVKDALEAAGAGELKPGSTGPRVIMLQHALNDRLKLSPTLKVDGDFGGLTEDAVADFQEQNHLPRTGDVDDKTWAALGLPPADGYAVYGPGHSFNIAQGAVPLMPAQPVAERYNAPNLWNSYTPAPAIAPAATYARPAYPVPAYAPPARPATAPAASGGGAGSGSATPPAGDRYSVPRINLQDLTKLSDQMEELKRKNAELEKKMNKLGGGTNSNPTE